MLFAARDEEAIVSLAGSSCGGVIGLVIVCLFLTSLMKALSACSPRNQAMAPGLVWLNLIPLFSVIWLFITVSNISKSLKREFEDRGLGRGDGSYGQVVGMIYAASGVLYVVVFLSGLGITMAVKEKEMLALTMLACCLIGLVGFIMFIVYWVQIAGFTRELNSSRRSRYDDDYDRPRRRYDDDRGGYEDDYRPRRDD